MQSRRSQILLIWRKCYPLYVQLTPHFWPERSKVIRGQGHTGQLKFQISGDFTDKICSGCVDSVSLGFS